MESLNNSVAVKAKSTFDIEADFYEICSMLEENDGEITPEIAKMMEVSEHDIEETIKRYHRYIQIAKANTTYIKEEVERIQKKIKTQANLITNIKDKALNILNKFGAIGKTGNRSLKYPDLNVFTRDNQKVTTNDLYDRVVNMAIDPYTHDELLPEYSLLNEVGDVTISFKCSVDELFTIFKDNLRLFGSDFCKFEYKLDDKGVKERANIGQTDALKKLGINVETNQSVTFK